MCAVEIFYNNKMDTKHNGMCILTLADIPMTSITPGPAKQLRELKDSQKNRDLTKALRGR